MKRYKRVRSSDYMDELKSSTIFLSLNWSTHTYKEIHSRTHFCCCDRLIFFPSFQTDRKVGNCKEINSIMSRNMVIIQFQFYSVTFTKADAFSMFPFSPANIYFYVFANDVRKMSGKVRKKSCSTKKTEMSRESIFVCVCGCGYRTKNASKSFVRRKH